VGGGYQAGSHRLDNGTQSVAQQVGCKEHLKGESLREGVPRVNTALCKVSVLGNHAGSMIPSSMGTAKGNAE